MSDGTHPSVRSAALAAALTLSSLGANAQDAVLRTELAPTGTLRVGLVEAPSAGVLFVKRDAEGKPRGVTVDLGGDLARAIGMPVTFSVYPNTGRAADATKAGEIDVTFMPVDEVRRQMVDFGPGYYELESTYLASAASGVSDVAQIDRPGLRVVAIAGTTTLRASARTLTATQPEAVPSVAEAIERMRTGQADAFALSRDTLKPIVVQVPGSRIVSGHFQQTLVAIAVPKGRPAALAFATAWLEKAKGSGVVRRAFDVHGLTEEGVAP